jgi:hypothetical protein
VTNLRILLGGEAFLFGSLREAVPRKTACYDVEAWAFSGDGDVKRGRIFGTSKRLPALQSMCTSSEIVIRD